jgi:hypothetical protein
MYLEPYQSEQQHGFRPGRGIHTAWLKFLVADRLKDYIFEYDLKGFFNEVPLQGVFESLYNCKVPISMINYLIYLNRTEPKLNPRYEGKVDYSDPEIGQLTFRKDNYGVAQGLPTSPILATITLGFRGLYKLPGTQYADDGYKAFNIDELPGDPQFFDRAFGFAETHPRGSYQY